MASACRTIELDSSFTTVEVKIPCASVTDTDRTGQHIWASSFLFLSAAEQGVFEVKGRSVLELGAGTHGLVGRTFKRWWPDCHVTLTDGMPTAVEALQDAITGSGESCCVQEVDWTIADGTCELEYADLIIGVDIVYDERLVQPLVDTLGVLITRRNEAWLALEERDPETMQGFFRALSKERLQHEVVSYTESARLQSDKWLSGAGPVMRHSEHEKMFLVHIKKG
eukprot:TRINITY_DN67264_c0_g1_i1.p1 TRINITY_DN67264_c0_g1~~TRINITY_DN67264_c0_g1_i1.p1  ORF type:complete len:225 (-),score=35.34 TRINITY_DN67264_c0_g1_i1:9-683(-)